MAVLLTSGSPLGLRALGSGGRTAVASYEQIARTLLQSFGSEHAALFAEPNGRATTIDWFANVDANATSVRLVDAPDVTKQTGLTTLERLVHDIQTKAVALQKSDRQDERILGDMLAHALEIPGEDAVFLVGRQPVMTFWGYVRDQGTPVVAPLRALLSRRSADLAAGTAGVPSPGRAALPPLPHHASAAPRREGRATGLMVPVILWSVFTLLLLTVGVELLRGCAIGLPHSLTGWLLNYCPGESDGTSASSLAAERSKQDQFRAEYEDLIRQAALRRQACFMDRNKSTPLVPDTVKPVKIEPVRPDVIKPNDKDQLHIPDKKPDNFAFLEGCWKAHRGLTEVRGGKDTGKQLRMTFCFNGDGSGSRTIRYIDDNAKCTGSAAASFDKDLLTIDFSEASCEGPRGGFQAARATCRRGEAGVAICEEYPRGESKPDFKDFPFIRSTEAP